MHRVHLAIGPMETSRADRTHPPEGMIIDSCRFPASDLLIPEMCDFRILGDRDRADIQITQQQFFLGSP